MSPEIRKNIYFIANNFFNFKEQEIIFYLTQNEVNRPVWNLPMKIRGWESI